MRPDTSAKPPAGVNHVIILEYETHGKSFEASADSEYEDTCKIKQGHLGIVTRKEKPGDSNRNSINLDGGPQIFHVRPVFAVLNTKTLSLFDNEHVTNLYKAVTLDHVTHTQEEPELTLSKIWCFDVYRGPKKTEKTPQPLIQLCAETEEKMNYITYLYSVCFKNTRAVLVLIQAVERFQKLHHLIYCTLIFVQLVKHSDK